MEKGIKVGDRVRVSEDAPRIYTDGWRFDWRKRVLKEKWWLHFRRAVAVVNTNRN